MFGAPGSASNPVIDELAVSTKGGYWLIRWGWVAIYSAAIGTAILSLQGIFGVSPASWGIAGVATLLIGGVLGFVAIASMNIREVRISPLGVRFDYWVVRRFVPWDQLHLSDFRRPREPEVFFREVSSGGRVIRLHRVTERQAAAIVEHAPGRVIRDSGLLN
jgi:hypothetical protein